jgi:hypothetical protein
MTPIYNTLYSVTLFLALVSLNLWSERRYRVARAYRKAALAPKGEGQGES